MKNFLNDHSHNSLKLLLIGIFVSLSIMSYGQKEKFWDQTLSIDERVKNLVSLLTPEEKISLMIETSPGIPRLGIPKYYMGNESLHGVVRPGKFTVFPQAIGLAAMWNPDLLKETATAISDEARARWNELKRGELQNAKYSDLLVFWSPDLNLARDPRWGRTQETFGEDPLLTSILGVSYIQGLQGNNRKYLKVIATPKHFTGNNEEHNRFECNAVMSERSLREYYLKPFEAAIRTGKAYSIMSAYNAINGVPCTANQKLLTEILRNEWGFKGYVVSDCGAPGYLVTRHNYLNSFEASAVACLNAGLDLECGGFCGTDCFVFRDNLYGALQKGFIRESQLDSAVMRIMTPRFMMGVFDKKVDDNPYNAIQPSVVGCEKHQKLALLTAEESIVLLKNEKHILPIDTTKIKKIALFGPNASKCIYGDYSAKESANHSISILEGLKDKLGDRISLVYVPWNDNNNSFKLIEDQFLFVEKDKKNGLKTEYYSNHSFTGTPSSRIESKLDFVPKNQAPDPFVPQGEKSIRWTTEICPGADGIYTFELDFMNHVKLFVDNNLNFDKKAKPNKIKKEVFDMFLHKNKRYQFVIEYSTIDNDDFIQLKWKQPESEDALFKKEKEIAAQSDLVVVVMGLDTNIEKEGQDKKSLNLPNDQQMFLSEIYKANQNIITILQSGSPLSLGWIKNKIPAILNTWYSGEQGGAAIANVLVGDYNPAGRLPLTYYNTTDDLPSFNDYEITNGRTYMYSKKTSLFPFGFGLSYTNFKYSNFKILQKRIQESDSIKISVDITNIGKYDGDEVIQLYVKNDCSKQIQPQKSLKAFKRLHLKSGETKNVILSFDAKCLETFYEDQHRFSIDKGKYQLFIGSSSDDVKVNSEFYMM